MTVQDIIDKLTSLPEEDKKKEIFYRLEDGCYPIYDIKKSEIINNPFYERRIFPDDQPICPYITVDQLENIKQEIMKDDILYDCEEDKFYPQEDKKVVIII